LCGSVCANLDVLSMPANRRKAVRRAIGYGARILATDGAWDRACRVLDVSQTGAKLAVEGRRNFRESSSWRWRRAAAQRGVAAWSGFPVVNWA
jgi:hypothetical protein